MANDLSAFNSEAWSKQVVENLDQINIMRNLVNRDWEGDLRHNKTVKVRTYGNVSMRTYVPNSTVITYEDLKPQKQDFTVADYSYFSFQVDDVDFIQTDLNALAGYAQRAAVAMNDAVEAKLTAAYSRAAVSLGAPNVGVGAILTPVLSAGGVASVTITAGGTGYTTPVSVYFYGGNGRGATATATQSGGIINNVTVTAAGAGYTVAPKVGITTTTGVTLDSTAGASGIFTAFLNARTVLGNQNVPATPGSRWAVIDPATAALLMNDTVHFVRSTNLGDNIVQTALVQGGAVQMTARTMPGFIGMVAGFNVFESNHIPISGANKFLMFGTNDAISYAAQIVSTEPIRVQTSFADAIRGLLVHDTFVADENAKRLVTVRVVA